MEFDDTSSLSSSPDNTDDDQDFNPDGDGNVSTSSASEPQTPAARSRKRLRNEKLWKKNKAKSLRDSGKEYVGFKKVLKRAKCVQAYDHSCRYECKSFTEEDRESIFKNYWSLKSWNLQSAFINGCMEKLMPKRKQGDAARNKNVSVVLKLKNKRVCKMFFIKTLDISVKRYDNVLKARNETGVPHADMRGIHAPNNKISDDTIKVVRKHIESFPNYSSHYSRLKNPNKKYLSNELSIHKMHELYLQYCKEENIENPVKESYYRHIFTTCYNLSFKKPQSDTCNTCDILQNKIDNGQNQNIVDDAKTKKEFHLRKAEKARAAKEEAKNLAKENSLTTKAICFDLEKTLPTPLLTCSKVYYMRQLWTYNLDIHDLGNGSASMFMWHEGEGSRGSQEIGSCLLKFTEQLDPNISHLIAFSDNCGGQNKSRFIIKFWMYIVQNTNIKTVDHKFLISGHSFMECDQDFGIIENAKKKQRYVMVPEDWMNVVAGSSRKFQVVRMSQDDFKSVEPMNDIVIDKIPGISKFQWIRLQKSEPFKLYYKESLNEDLEFLTKSMILPKKKGRPSATFGLKPLYNEAVKIAPPKYRNLQELLVFVPPIHHQFYKGLKTRQPTSRHSNENEEPDEDDLDRVWDSE